MFWLFYYYAGKVIIVLNYILDYGILKCLKNPVLTRYRDR